MEVKDNEIGGQTLVLQKGDRLTDVPLLYRRWITPQVKTAFEDVPGYFSVMAAKTPFPAMEDWLRALIKENRWSLKLHSVFAGEEPDQLGFSWSSDVVLGAEIGLPDLETKIDWPLPQPLADLHRLTSFVNWSGFACGGGFIQPSGLYSVTVPTEPNDWRTGIDWNNTPFWGGFNGAGMFATLDDRAGWVKSGDGRTVIVGGSVAEIVNWWFSKLLARAYPDYEQFEEDFQHNSYWHKRSAS